jgi:hypothetical protein
MATTAERLFHVIVIGGIGLTGCGGETISSSSTGAGGATASTSGQGGFPAEGVVTVTTVTVGAGGAPMNTSGGSGGFPREGPDASGGSGGFPREGPNPCYPQTPPCPPDADASDGPADVRVIDGRFPDEGADVSRYDAFPQEGPPPPPDAFPITIPRVP